MIKFLLIGLLRDPSRSRLPVLVVAIGVMLTVLMHAYITGLMGDTIEMNARFSNGHVKVMTRAYAENTDMIPNDMALLEVDSLLDELQSRFPEMQWATRIHFGGLIDVADESGETRSQGTAIGFGIDMLSPNSEEIDRLNLENALIRGNLPRQPGEILISDGFAQKLKVEPGAEVTFIGSTMYGAMILHNFTISGTISFGIELMDKGSVVVDIEDVRSVLDMYDAAGEIVGFLAKGYYNDRDARQVSHAFNEAQTTDDEYTPLMLSLSEQGSMGTYVSISKVWALYVSMIFVFAMSLVLWNAGLLGGLRRYGEIGVRLAMGETRSHVYRTMIYESVMIGIAGSVVGTAFGLFFAWLLQTYGIDISDMMEGASLMMPTRLRARITPMDYYIGFIPGLVSTVIGTMLAGIGIFKRQTARLFKELEV